MPQSGNRSLLVSSVLIPASWPSSPLRWPVFWRCLLSSYTEDTQRVCAPISHASAVLQSQLWPACLLLWGSMQSLAGVQHANSKQRVCCDIQQQQLNPFLLFLSLNWAVAGLPKRIAVLENLVGRLEYLLGAEFLSNSPVLTPAQRQACVLSAKGKLQDSGFPNWSCRKFPQRGNSPSRRTPGFLQTENLKIDSFFFPSSFF